MGFLRVTSGVAAVPIPDLGYEIPAATTVDLSAQFSVNDLYLSADLEALIIATTLTVELDYGTGWQSVAAADYTNRDCIGSFLNIYTITNENNNEDLVDGSEVNASGPSGAALHVHDARYYTETELGSATTSPAPGASLVGVDDAAWVNLTPNTTVQGTFDTIDGLFNTLVTLDAAYDNDSDGILDVDGTTKPLIFRSNNSNDVIINRKSGSDTNTFLLADVSADELVLGSAAVGALNKIDVRVATNLTVDGNFTFTGTITDTTVSIMNVTNASIMMRDGAATGADAFVYVERGSTGADADLKWNETTTRWMAGVVGSEKTIALLEADENVTGVWEFTGSATTDPNIWLKDKAAAPSTKLGAAGDIPIASINNALAIYDRTRTKWLGIDRQQMYFTGRDNANNKDEYARTGLFASNQAGFRLLRNSTLVGMSVQTNAAQTWNMRVRKNGSATNLATLAVAAVAGAHVTNTSVDFSAGDWIMVYIDGGPVDRPAITLEFAPKY